MIKTHLLPALLLAVLFSACMKDLRPFTQTIRDRGNWSEDQMKRIQFYLSQDVVLRRAVQEGEAAIEGGEIKFIDGQRVEQVRFPSGTPGVLSFMPKEKRMAITFEDGGKDRYLMFGPNENRGGEYVLLGKEWKNHQGIITYDGKEWNTDVHDGLAKLLVDMKLIRKYQTDERVAKGVKVQ